MRVRYALCNNINAVRYVILQLNVVRYAVCAVRYTVCAVRYTVCAVRYTVCAVRYAIDTQGISGGIPEFCQR